MFDWIHDTILQPVFDGASAIGDFFFGPDEPSYYPSLEDGPHGPESTFSGDIIGSFLAGSSSSGSSSNKASAIAAEASMRNRRDILQMKRLQGDRWVKESVKNRMSGLPMLPTDRATDMREQAKNILNRMYADAMRNGRGRRVADKYAIQLKNFGIDVNPYATEVSITDQAPRYVKAPTTLEA